MNLSPILA